MSDDADTEFDAEAWRAELDSHRADKDEFFGDHPQSPIPPEDRDGFDGLDYFSPDPDYRVAATATVFEEPETVSIETTAGPDQEYFHIGTLRFELDGEERTLEAYRQAGQAHLFVPFTDGTTGEETYGKGRYMEFDVEGDLEEGQTVTLDFNLAYSPFCAYSDTFACPLPPEGNHLETRIEAGERV